MPLNVTDEAEAMDVDEGADPMLLDRIDDNGAVNAQEPTPSGGFPPCNIS